MSYYENRQRMEAFSKAGLLVSALRVDVAGFDPYAWNKLISIANYFGKEPIALGRKMFADPEAQELPSLEV